MKEIAHQLLLLIGFIDERSAEEKLDAIVNEHKHRSLLDDILRIRRSGDYVPNYNRPRLYTDYHLIRTDGLSEVMVGMNTITTCPRPVDFGNDLEKWLLSIHKDNTETAELKRMRKQSQEELENAIEKLYSPYIQKKMMEIN